jgi:hypothetical protein
MPNLSYAIAELEIVREIAIANAPIHEAEGNTEQSELCRRRAESCDDAISLLGELSK